MDTIEAIYARRSVKHYDSQHEFTEAEINTLMDAAVQSPTSFNMQNWRFILVKDRALREKFKAASWGQAQVQDASLLIILAADLLAPLKDPARYWQDAPENVRNMMAGMIPGFYADKPEIQRDEAMRSCGIAAQSIMLAAKSMGYDTCPMVGFDPVKIGELIKLPENYVISMLITVGKALKPAQPKGGYLPKHEVIFWNSFG